ncbi:extensin-like [Mustela erminea]|uniref:extensin-like n=1 Tax=Mustela erminea TaxID=36723 RepID=UPI001386F367|nr:extensin-like [Mustela erminea]
MFPCTPVCDLRGDQRPLRQHPRSPHPRASPARAPWSHRQALRSQGPFAFRRPSYPAPLCLAHGCLQADFSKETISASRLHLLWLPMPPTQGELPLIAQSPPPHRTQSPPPQRTQSPPPQRTVPAPSSQSPPPRRAVPAPSSRTVPAPSSRTVPAPSSHTVPAPSLHTDPAPSSHTVPAPSAHSPRPLIEQSPPSPHASCRTVLPFLHASTWSGGGRPFGGLGPVAPASLPEPPQCVLPKTPFTAPSLGTCLPIRSFLDFGPLSQPAGAGARDCHTGTALPPQQDRDVTRDARKPFQG